jgi:23S rRNA (adenine2503-C2)-methyltransferase
MGEPLANYRAVMGAVRRLHRAGAVRTRDERAWVTVSTVGLVPRINQAAASIPVTLALSLHAPDDELRNEWSRSNTRFSVDETVDAAWNYARVASAGSPSSTP